jgi:hypothetical protein
MARPFRSGLLNAILLTAIGAVFLAGCGGASESDSDSGKFDQTWGKKIADTTCADWTGKMKEHERFVMAADFISAVEDRLPKDTVIQKRADEITSQCGKTPNQDIAHVNSVISVYGAGSDEATAALAYELDRGTGTAHVTHERFGKTWPLTVESGQVNCAKEANGSVAVFFYSDDSADDEPGYALNGYAKGSKTMEFYGLQSVDPIWADDPETGYKKDIGVLIDICKPYME